MYNYTSFYYSSNPDQLHQNIEIKDIMVNIIAFEGSYLHELAHGNRSNPCYLVSSDLVFLVVCFDTHPTECFLYLHTVHTMRLVNYFKTITWCNLHNMDSETRLAQMNSTLTRSLSVRGREASRKLRNSSTNWTTVTDLKKDVADMSEKWKCRSSDKQGQDTLQSDNSNSNREGRGEEYLY